MLWVPVLKSCNYLLQFILLTINNIQLISVVVQLKTCQIFSPKSSVKHSIYYHYVDAGQQLFMQIWLFTIKQ